MTYTFVYNICDGREMLDYWHNDRRSRILASACDKIGDGVCKILMTCWHFQQHWQHGQRSNTHTNRDTNTDTNIHTNTQYTYKYTYKYRTNTEQWRRFLQILVFLQVLVLKTSLFQISIIKHNWETIHIFLHIFFSDIRPPMGPLRCTLRKHKPNRWKIITNTIIIVIVIVFVIVFVIGIKICSGSRGPRSRRSSWTAWRRSSGRSSTCPSPSGLSSRLSSNSQKHRWALQPLYLYLSFFSLCLRLPSELRASFAGENLVPEQASEDETAARIGSWTSPVRLGAPHAATLRHPALPPPRHAPGLRHAPLHHGLPLPTMIQARSCAGARLRCPSWWSWETSSKVATTMVHVVTKKHILSKEKDRQRERNSKKSVCDISSTINHNSCRCKNQPEKKFNSVDLSGC